MNTFNKAISGAFILAASISANADLQVGGTVEPILSLDVAEAANIADMDLSQVTTNLLLATTTENSNLPAGYTINVSTANNFTLVSSEDGAKNLTYRLSFHDVNVPQISFMGLIHGQAFVSAALEGGNTDINVTHDLEMSFSGIPAAEMVAGNYNDTISITIQAN